LPAAMVAPTPVSALLHAVAVVKAGVFTVLKVVVYIFGIDHLNAMIAQNWWAGGWLIYAAGSTIIIASVIAMRQDNLKKRLAFSTISQLSYVVLAVAILSPKAAMAGAFHIAAHAVSKITLFFAAGSIYTASKKKNVSELNGIGKRMPITMACFTIGALSMIGLPPAAGFLTKFYMMMGALETQHYFAIGVLLVSTVLNAAYFLPIIFAAYFKAETEGGKDHGEAPKPILIAISITAFLTLALFFYPDVFLFLSDLGVMQ
jgi:multicomponent Na+:H+ antiporter subunit D